MKYFTDCKTLEELKKAYRRLAMENHPDRGGSVEVMQTINSEYEMLFNEMKNVSASASGSRKQTQETAADFISIIDKIINLEGITIEICGTWLWVGGNTKPVKDILMDAGLFYASKKKMWYWAPPEAMAKTVKRKVVKTKSMTEIRTTYGSKVISANKNSMVRI